MMDSIPSYSTCQVGLTPKMSSRTVLVMTFSDWLAERLNDRAWSHQRLADQVGVTKMAVKGWLDGARPRVETCYRLADVFGVAADHVLRLAGYPTQSPSIDLSKIDYREVIRAQHPPDTAQRMVDVLNALEGHPVARSGRDEPPYQTEQDIRRSMFERMTSMQRGSAAANADAVIEAIKTLLREYDRQRGEE